MHKNFIMSRLGGTAIVAVLALTATPAFAQEATPQDATPQITVPTETPAPVVAEPAVTPTVDPLAAQPTAEIDTTASQPVEATTTKKTAKPTPKATAKVPVSTRAAATAAPVAAATPPAADPALPAEAPVIDPPIPVAPLAAAPDAAPAPAAVEATADDTLPIALGAGLGLLALGGAAFALRRRRRDYVEDDVIVSEPTIARRPEPAMTPQPAMAERSAFSWGVPAATATTASSSAHGKSWVDRAHEGPTAENPFLSLKKRLQRAAFYDQRERAVAAGKAKPLSPMAGLPKRFAEAFRPKTSTPAYGFSYVPA